MNVDHGYGDDDDDFLMDMNRQDRGTNILSTTCERVQG